MGRTHRWYSAGLAFECTKCGGCCSGPGEGVIWVTSPEIRQIAEHLAVSPSHLRNRYLRREGSRMTLIEEMSTHDCIFLKVIGGHRQCLIYPVRPNQCRTWPFWSGNLASEDTWNQAAQRCPGINRGRLLDLEQIERIKAQKRWWNHD